MEKKNHHGCLPHDFSSWWTGVTQHHFYWLKIKCISSWNSQIIHQQPCVNDGREFTTQLCTLSHPNISIWKYIGFWSVGDKIVLYYSCKTLYVSQGGHRWPTITAPATWGYISKIWSQGVKSVIVLVWPLLDMMQKDRYLNGSELCVFIRRNNQMP